MDDKWNDLIGNLPDELLNQYRRKNTGTVGETLNSLQDTITALETNKWGDRQGELMLV